ncbi:YihY/virulence factor BrkB family protein [Erythrobacter sp. JK5]|uniref:YihY/virulence factor BrkB family protein n=1 Tax=Erythrobacter sp. JK5 TaxID=2829500 RepID=UPI001BAE1792|nr:YihY/virulence factor BrkB family protein [Erythrobacter sp. JK5]QUL37355.1 YihY/virulence factor BrkB family protein [Erythrobacter sp. JK5]
MEVPPTIPPPDEREVISLTPEARRRHSRSRIHALVGSGIDPERPARRTLAERLVALAGPGTRAFEVVKRTAVGTYNDGFIHAGNLAYLSMLAIFPFFILGAAAFELIGGREQTNALVDTVVMAMPPTVASAIAPVAQDVMGAREGWLLWFGAAVALWTVSSLVETIRDILRRAYGTRSIYAFWKYRLLSAGLILGAVVLLMASLFAHVVIGTAQQVIDAALPQLSEAIAVLQVSRIIPAIGLGLSLYMLFYTLTPSEYRKRGYPKWPGALFTTVWWLGVTTAMPPILRSVFAYNLTYGSLAGIIIALFFFWLVGLGLVIGAELNAALAEPEPCKEETMERALAREGEMQEGSAS